MAEEEVVEGRFEEVGVEEVGGIVDDRLVTVDGGIEDEEPLGFGVDAALEDGSTVEDALDIMSCLNAI